MRTKPFASFLHSKNEHPHPIHTIGRLQFHTRIHSSPFSKKNMEHIKKMQKSISRLEPLVLALLLFSIIQFPQGTLATLWHLCSLYSYSLPKMILIWYLIKKRKIFFSRYLEWREERKRQTEELYFGIRKEDFARFYFLDQVNQSNLMDRFQVSRTIAEKILRNLEHKNALVRGDKNRLCISIEKEEDLLPLLHEDEMQIVQ